MPRALRKPGETPFRSLRDLPKTLFMNDITPLGAEDVRRVGQHVGQIYGVIPGFLLTPLQRMQIAGYTSPGCEAIVGLTADAMRRHPQLFPEGAWPDPEVLAARADRATALLGLAHLYEELARSARDLALCDQADGMKDVLVVLKETERLKGSGTAADRLRPACLAGVAKLVDQRNPRPKPEKAQKPAKTPKAKAPTNDAFLNEWLRQRPPHPPAKAMVPSPSRGEPPTGHPPAAPAPPAPPPLRRPPPRPAPG